MNDTTRRVVAYSTATALLSVLGWAGFVYRADPDFDTMLGAINTQLRLAHAIPPVDKQGKPLSAREDMLAAAAAMLDRAERQQPQNPMVAEFRGFYCMLRGDCRAAAGHYRRARTMGPLEPDQRDTLVFNEARMLKQTGDKAAALAVFADNQGSMQAKFLDQCHVEQADLLHDLGRDAEAAEQLRPLLQHVDEHPMATLQAGTLFEAMGQLPTADEAYSEAAKAVPGANYHRARLKLRAGDTDRCLELLQLASDAAPAEVRRQIREDQSAWQALAADARFRKLADPDAAATPGR